MYMRLKKKKHIILYLKVLISQKIAKKIPYKSSTFPAIYKENIECI